MATKKFTDPWIRGLKRADPGKRYEWLDEGETGLALMVNDKRRITFLLIARWPKEDGSVSFPSRKVLGDYRPPKAKDRENDESLWKEFPTKKGLDILTLEDARDRAKAWKALIARGIDPKAPTPPIVESSANTFERIFDQFFDLHVLKIGVKDQQGNPETPLRSQKEIKRIFETYVLDWPTRESGWRNRLVDSVRRTEVASLLNDVQRQRGAAQADAVLLQLSKFFRWYEGNGGDESFVSPIALQSMRKTKPKERKRDRVLGDKKGLGDREIAIFWEACGNAGTLGAFCRFALLTGQRRSKIAAMKWDQLTGKQWIIPAEKREKANAEVLILAPLAMSVVKSQPKRVSNPYVFGGRGEGPLKGFSKGKVALDKEIERIAGAAIPSWTIHDLRRTCRTLLGRCGVPTDDAERVLGHAIGGVRETYDQWTYLPQKTDALKKLDALMKRIIRASGEVVPLRASK